MFYIFFLTIMKQWISLWIRCCNFTKPMTVSGTRWHLLSSDVFLINELFIAQYCGHKRIKTAFYWIAGGVYWSAVSFTNPLVTITGPRCRLLIRDVIYKSAGVNYWSAEKIQMLKTDPKKVPRPKFVFARSSWYNDLTFYEKKIPTSQSL